MYVRTHVEQNKPRYSINMNIQMRATLSRCSNSGRLSIPMPGLGLKALTVLLAVLVLAAPLAGQELNDGRRQVVFIRYNLKSTTEPQAVQSTIVTEFKKTMARRGYVEGNNVEYIDIVTSSSDRTAVEEVLNATERYMHSADMFVTSSWTSLYVRSKLSQVNVPQLFAPALEATALNMLPSVTRESGTNLSGVYLTYPPEKILRLVRLILPGIKNYAYVFDSRIPADLIFKAAYGKLKDEERHGITIHFLDLTAGADRVLTQMNENGVEAYGGIVGAFVNSEKLSRSNLPVITSLMIDRDQASIAEYIQKSNIVAGLFNPFSYCGEQAADMAADIFDGINTIEHTVPRPARQVSFINMQSAARFKVQIPFTALEAVDLVIN